MSHSVTLRMLSTEISVPPEMLASLRLFLSCIPLLQWVTMVVTRSQQSRHPQAEQEYLSAFAGPANPSQVQPKVPNPVRDRTNRPIHIPQPQGLPFELQPACYGLIQERINASLYALVVQSILWNQTQGLKARPVLFELLARYPTPLSLSSADFHDLRLMLLPIGLHNTRAERLIMLAKTWVAAPPCKDRRYRKLHYPARGCGTDVKPGEVLTLDDEREGWEIAHLPGMGAYALDSFRIFFRDRLRGLEGAETIEPEWKRVQPTDKDLKAYIRWRWANDEG